jgi:ABC-type phosphate transport system permease subunit
LKKIIATLAVFLYISTLILTVSAESTSTPSASQQGSGVIGEIIGTVAIVVIFSVIAYAGYKIIKKWIPPSG